MHTIRLRHPWKSEVTDAQEVRFQRNFHRPSGLIDERLFLAVRILPSADWQLASIALNDQAVSLDGSGKAEVGDRLLAFNSLQIAFAAQTQADCPSAIASLAEVELHID